MVKRYKICVECGKKLLTQKHFYRDIKMKDKYKNICKTCMGIRKTNTTYFLPPEIVNLLHYHSHNEIKYFGFFLGYVITLRPGEYLAYSILKGSYIFDTKKKCRAWLCRRIVKAAKIIEHGLIKRLKDYEG